MPLDPAKIQGRLLACGGLITVGAGFAGAIACFPASAIGTALGIAASVLPGVAGSILASDCFEFAKRFRPSADVLRNHDLSKAVGMAIAIVICHIAKDKDDWTKTRLEELANKAVKFLPNYTIETDIKYLGIREEYLTALFDKSAADFTKVKALNRWEDWLDILNWLSAEGIPKITHIPEEVLGEIAQALHDTFPQALREVLKQNPVAFAGMMLLLMGEFITEIRESKAELASKCDLILAEVQEIKSRNSNLGESLQLPQIWLDSFQSWMVQVESGLRDELRAIAHNLVTIETKVDRVQDTASETLGTTKRIEEKIDKIIPQTDIDLSDPYPNISDFIGRDKEINELHDLLAEGKKQLIGITGVGGMGKSTLAAKIYQETRVLEETGFLGKFWVDILRNPEMRLFTGMARLVLRQFLHLPEDSPILQDEPNLPKRLLTCLQNNKYLLVIDNLETLLQDGQFRDSFYQQFFQDWLEYGGKSVILVTTQERWNLPSDNCVELIGFKPEAGLMLLKTLGITGREEGLQAFSQRVKGHPLALKLVAGFLKEEEGENADISFLDKNPLQISGWHRGETVSVEEVLAASFNRLDERLKKLLLNVSVYRLRFNSLAAAAVMGEENVEEDLRLLVRKSLLQEERENRQWWFQFQPLVLEYVRGIAGDLKEAHERAIVHYYKIAKNPPWHTIEDLTERLEIFYHLCQLQKYGEAFLTIYDCVDRFLDLRGYNKLRVKIYTSLVDCWQPTDENEKGKFGAVLISLGAAYNSLGKYQQAIWYHQQSLEIYRCIGNPSWEAASLGNLGHAYDSLGRYQQAIDYYQQALEICKEINYLNGKANSLGNLGSTYNSLGQYEQAIQSHQQSLEIRHEIGDLRGKANSLNGLGNAYNNLGQYQQAIDYYQQAVTIFKEIGDLHGEAVYLNNLGNVYRYIGQYEKGIDFHQQSLKIVSEIDDPKGQAECLGNIGRAYESLGQYHKAIEYTYQQLTIARKIDSRQEEAAALNNLGTAYRSLGQYDQAIESCKEALKILRQIGNHQNEAKCLTNLGYAYDSLREYQQSIDYYQQALDIEQRTGNRQGEVASLNNLGCAYYYLKHYQQAIHFYQQSVKIARLIGDKRDEAKSWKNLSISYHQIGKFKEGYTAAYQASLILKELGLPLETMPYPNWVKLIAKFAQRGKWQLALCFILGLFAFPFALVWIVSLMLWRVVRAQFRRRS